MTDTTRIAVLGAGSVGTAVAADLCSLPGTRLLVADIDQRALDIVAEEYGGQVRRLDVTSPEALGALFDECRLVISALPEAIGEAALRAAVERGRDIVDVSFHEADFESLAAAAERSGSRAAVDCGIAPGLSSMLVGDAAGKLTKIEEVVILVGGLPVERKPPWEYKAVFSPTGVLAEYTRPVRVLENGREQTIEALSELELADFSGIGTLEAFNTDGLRTLLRTIPARRMREKTLRYPGHAEKLRLLRDSGFFSATPVALEGGRVRPIDMTAALLFAEWKLEPREHDLLVMRITVRGHDEQGARELRYELRDDFDPASGLNAMARTTGFTAAAAARCLLAGYGPERGLIAPETLGMDPAAMNLIKRHLDSQGIRWTCLDSGAH